MLYFAFGSNMEWHQMRHRCPSAQFVCIAKASGYRLAFTHNSKTRGCGAADMVESASDEVWGCVFQIDEVDVGPLDKSEGFQPGRTREANSYERVEIHVQRDGEVKTPLAVWTYTVVKKLDPCQRPSGEYKQLIVDGARQWHLPADYIEHLQGIEIG